MYLAGACRTIVQYANHSVLSPVRTIYEKLAGAFVDDIKEIYLQRVDELSPSIRYCAYNIGDESAIEDLRQMRVKTGTTDALASRLDVSLKSGRSDFWRLSETSF